MADMRQYAGGGAEAQQHRESAPQYQQAQYARIAAPNIYQPLESYPEYTQRRAQEAAAKDAMADSLAGVSANPLGGGIAQQLRAPGKMFSRETFLAILRAKEAECRSPRRMGQTPDGLLVLAELIDIIENLE